VPQPNVVFIDDSATMREVVKIAFRRENIDVVTFSDATSALTDLETNPADIVITDVIMPDHDGYEVCQRIKEHPKLSATPVILMSGVVNRAVAERAFAVKAAELIRKPFQPQDLIARVKHLLQPKASATAQNPSAAVAALSSIFAAPQAQRRPGHPVLQMPVPLTQSKETPAAAVAAAVAAKTVVVPPKASVESAPALHPAATNHPNAAIASGDFGKLRIETMRLEGLVRKLQSELAAEREYSRALEEHIKTLQES
jgi:DNA-binding response OmpR family regulator